MTSTYTAIAIWSRTLFLRSNNGVVLPPAMPRTSLHSSPSSRFVVSHYGSKSHDDTA